MSHCVTIHHTYHVTLTKTAASTCNATPSVRVAGAVVLELLPYNWEWKGISQLYHNITRSIGDIHHFAWRAAEPKWATYDNEDEARYSYWTPEECHSRHCLEVHARAGMVADTDSIRDTLLGVLPKAFAGQTVEELAKPWPQTFNHTGATGMWWDK